jgi:uncharacterized protein (TIGR00297 family)
VNFDQMTSSGLAHSPTAAAAVTLVFAGLARLLRGVTWSGTVAGAAVSFLLYVCAGPGAFLALVTVFVITAGTTRIGYARKQQLGTAERREGRRASQIFANLGVAAVASVIFKISRDQAFLLGVAAALAEAASDTTSSEIGQASSGRARLITSFAVVPAGTDGGITFAGTLTGGVAAVFVSSVFTLVRLLPARSMAVASVAGFSGMVLDSVLGALLERRKMLSNDVVNFLGTLSAALIAIAVAKVI